ncbi:MAG: hypothetical protein WKF41_12950 [Gaiellaceae bacterium]
MAKLNVEGLTSPDFDTVGAATLRYWLKWWCDPARSANGEEEAGRDPIMEAKKVWRELDRGIYLHPAERAAPDFDLLPFPELPLQQQRLRSLAQFSTERCHVEADDQVVRVWIAEPDFDRAGFRRAARELAATHPGAARLEWLIDAKHLYRGFGVRHCIWPQLVDRPQPSSATSSSWSNRLRRIQLTLARLRQTTALCGASKRCQVDAALL